MRLGFVVEDLGPAPLRSGESRRARLLLLSEAVIANTLHLTLDKHAARGTSVAKDPPARSAASSVRSTDIFEG
jgi:hypothetical protein